MDPHLKNSKSWRLVGRLVEAKHGEIGCVGRNYISRVWWDSCVFPFQQTDISWKGSELGDFGKNTHNSKQNKNVAKRTTWSGILQGETVARRLGS